MNGRKSRKLRDQAFELSTKPKKYYIHKETNQMILEPKCARFIKQRLKRTGQPYLVV